MPATLGSEFKEDRMKLISERISKNDYDLFLLEELWMSPDHDTIAAKVPENYTMTGFRQLSLPTCDGKAGPDFCSKFHFLSPSPQFKKSLF